MPSASFDHTVAVPLDQDTVWGQMQLPETWEGLGPVTEVWDPEFGDDGRLCAYRWRVEAGPRTIEGTAQTTESVAPGRMVIAMHAGEFSGVIGTHLTPDDEGTSVLVEIDLEGRGLLTSMFWGPLTKIIGDGLPEQVEGLVDSMVERAE
jgi:hypothetical protein